MIITQTPVRLSLLGGNTDFPAYFLEHGGAVLTTTIDKYVYCIVKERFDDEIWINYSIKEKVNHVDDIQHDLVREAMKLVGVEKGIEITFLSDIPAEGSGLGSSSAVTVGVLNALHNYQGESVTARQLAEEACTIEVDLLNKPIGYQDQYAVAFGGTNIIKFGSTIEVLPFPLENHEYFMLLYTGITRKADNILAKMSLDTAILDRNKALVYEAKGNDIGKLAQLINEYWSLKRELNSSVSNEAIDTLCAQALEAEAWAVKVVGAGGGGFLLLLADPSYKRVIKERLGLKELPFTFTNTGSKVIFNSTK